jgi:integrase
MSELNAQLKHSRAFYLLAQGNREANKPPAPIPPRLPPHMRRWVRLGIASNYFVEWRGKPVKSVTTALNTATRLAGITKQHGNVTPATLRHTAATWLMRAGLPVWTAADYLGMSVEVLLNTYGHHHPDYLREAADAFGGKSQGKRFCGPICGRPKRRPSESLKS